MNSVINFLSKTKISTLVFILSLYSCQSVSKLPTFTCSSLENKEPTNNILAKSNDKQVMSNPNCLGHCPIKTNGNNILVDHDIILLSFNSKTKFADWVAYRVEKQNMMGKSKLRIWAKDPKLDKKITLIPSDYKGLSYDPYFFDRGHQAPLAAFKNHQKWYVVNYLSNITPQKKYLNQGPWNNLEAQERKLASNGKELYVLTGPYYDKSNLIQGPENKRINYIIPSGYWKIISIKDNKRVKTISFLFSQNTQRSASYCNHIVNIKTIESKAVLKFSKSLKNLNTKEQIMKKEIGC